MKKRPGKASKALQNTIELLIATFDNRDKAQAIVNALHTLGYTEEEIMLLVSGETARQHFQADIRAPHATEHQTLQGAGAGSAFGGILGALAGAFMAAGSSWKIPRLGILIAGPVAGSLAGAGAGSLTGGFLGTLIGAGIPEEKATHYHTVLQQGGLILGVHPHHAEDALLIQNRLEALEAAVRSITHEEIAAQAYDIYQAGSEDALKNWYQAEKELLNPRS